MNRWYYLMFATIHLSIAWMVVLMNINPLFGVPALWFALRAIWLSYQERP